MNIKETLYTKKTIPKIHKCYVGQIVVYTSKAFCLAQTGGTGKLFSTMAVAFFLDLKITVNLSHNGKDGGRTFSFQPSADKKVLLTIAATSLYMYQM